MTTTPGDTSPPRRSFDAAPASQPPLASDPGWEPYGSPPANWPSTASTDPWPTMPPTSYPSSGSTPAAPYPPSSYGTTPPSYASPPAGSSYPAPAAPSYRTPPTPAGPAGATPAWVSPKVAELLDGLGISQDGSSSRTRTRSSASSADSYAAAEQALLAPLPTHPYVPPPQPPPAPPASAQQPWPSTAFPSTATPPSSRAYDSASYQPTTPTRPAQQPQPTPPPARPQPPVEEDTEAVLARLMALVAEIPTPGGAAPAPEPEVPEPEPPRPQPRAQSRQRQQQPRQQQQRQPQQQQQAQQQPRQRQQPQARQPVAPQPPEPDFFEPDTAPIERDSALARLLAYSPENDELIAPAPPIAPASRQQQRQRQPQQQQPGQRQPQQRQPQQPGQPGQPGQPQQRQPQQRRPQPVTMPPEPAPLTIPGPATVATPAAAARPAPDATAPLSAVAAATAAARAAGAPAPMEARTATQPVITPARPVAPVAPVAPTTPTSPTTPVRPVAPTRPVAPVRPTPVSPTYPAPPEYPVPAIFTQPPGGPAQPATAALPVVEGSYSPPPSGRRALNQQPDLSTFQRLRLGAPTDRLMGWAVTMVITMVAFVVRVINLHYPNKLLFDETYYAKDAYSLLHFGYERNWPTDANASIAGGNPDVYQETAEFAVHPPVGKWLIAFGEHLFGMNGFGWRFMPLVFGTLLVFITIRLARRLSRSTLIGGIAGVLLTFDGLAFIMSRIALLDVFQAFFLVAAVSCCLADRDYYRARLANRLEALGIEDLNGHFGPIIWMRPWRLAAGVLFGLAIGTKWNSIFLLAVMGIVSVIWDVGARRLAGANYRAGLSVLIDGVPAFIRLVVVSAAIYVVTWAGWLTTEGGYNRAWAASNPDNPLVKSLPATWASFIQYHIEIFNFHTGEYIATQPHPYDAHPAGWLFMVRSIGIDAVTGIQPGTDGCTAPAGDTCVQVIDGVGTPVLWWFAAAALIVALIWRIGARDWRFGLPLVAMLATYVPWFFTTDRAQFFFYAITMIPFNVITLAMVLGLILGPADAPTRRRGGIIVGVILFLVVANFAWMYPVYTDQMLTHGQWLARMWLATWI